jgi:hypothetical protein
MKNKVQGIIELTGQEINDEIVCTTGYQLAMILESIKSQISSCIWYGADISVSNSSTSSLLTLNENPSVIGNTGELIKFSLQTDQFLSGVFLAVPENIDHPTWLRHPGTEDEPTKDLGDAILEIRAFDTSFFELYSSNSKIIESLTKYFKK